MLSPYSIITSDCDRNFSFQTSLGDVYFVYFTEFCLTKRNGQVLMVISFGFSCTEKSLKTTYDPRIKSTICFILKSFLERNKDEAIVYLCLNNDGKAQYRHRIFNQWFTSFHNVYDKHEIILNDFYASIIHLSTNQRKEEIIDSFEYTVKIFFKT